MNCSAGKIGTISKGSARANGLSTPPIGCVLHLPGLPGSGNKIYDRSPYGNIGTITGATWTRLPSGLWVLSFDGTDDRIEIPSLAMDGDRTLEVWVKTTAGNDGNNHNAVSWRYDADNLLFVRKNSTNDTWTWWVKCGGINVSDQAVAITDDALWHQIVLVIDKTNSKVYFYWDTVDKTSGGAAQAGTMVSDTATLHLGSDYYDGDVWIGSLAIARLYNRVLSAFEIQNHFNREKHLFGVW